jgi:hypothetical protein
MQVPSYIPNLGELARCPEESFYPDLWQDLQCAFVPFAEQTSRGFYDIIKGKYVWTGGGLVWTPSIYGMSARSNGSVGFDSGWPVPDSSFSILLLFRTTAASEVLSGCRDGGVTNEVQHSRLLPAMRIWLMSGGTLFNANGSKDVHDGIYHIGILSVSREQAMARLFVDGILDASISISTMGTLSTAGNLWLFAENASQYLAADIAAAYMWGRALSQYETQVLQTDPLIIFRRPLQRKYKLYVPPIGGLLLRRRRVLVAA